MMGLLAMKRLLELTGWLASARWPGSAGLYAKAAHWPIGRCPQPYSLHSTAQSEQKFSWIRYVSQKYLIISFMSQYNYLSGSISKRPASAGHLAGTFSSDTRPHPSVEEVFDAKKNLYLGESSPRPEASAVPRSRPSGSQCSTSDGRHQQCHALDHRGASAQPQMGGTSSAALSTIGEPVLNLRWQASAVPRSRPSGGQCSASDRRHKQCHALDRRGASAQPRMGGISSATPSTIWERVLSAGWEHLATPRVVPTGLRPPPLGTM